MKKGMPLALLAVILLLGCSSVEKREKERNQHLLHKVTLENLRIRRPAGEGADPGVNPGGPDYYGNPLPDAKFDCAPADSLFSSVSLPKMRECVFSISPPKAFVYRLRRLPVPVLELEEPENAPACLRELLPKIPVPREIFFQNNEAGPLNCFSSRLNLEADDVPGVGVKWPLSRTQVRIDLPPEVLVDSDRKTMLMLISWSLSPFFGESGEVILSHLVPDSICSKCLGEKKMYRPDGPPIPFWP